MNKKLFWLFALSAMTYFLQGIEGLPGMALFFYLKETLGLTAEKIMFFGSIIGLAWLVKPLWGYCIDNYLTKKIWIVISILGSIVTSMIFGQIAGLGLALFIGLAMFANWNTAMRDVAVDGIMCVQGKQYNKTGQIQAVQWTAITIAGIITGVGGGYIAEHFTYQMGYLCLIPFYIILLLLVLGYCNEQVVPSGRLPLIETLKSYKVLFTDKRFLLIGLFLFLYKYSPSFGTPLAFIERDVFHWSKQWMGTLGGIISVFEILGAILYFKYAQKLNIRKWLIWSVYLGALTSLAYLWFTPQTAIIYGILFSIIGMFIHLIIMDWMARNSIPGKEASSFALLCSVSNLAGTASSLSGAWLLPLVGLQPLIIISSLTSFLCLPLIRRVKL